MHCLVPSCQWPLEPMLCQERTFPDWNPHMSAEDREETERILAQAARKVHQAAPQQGDGNAPPFSESGLKITGHNREAGVPLSSQARGDPHSPHSHHNPHSPRSMAGEALVRTTAGMRHEMG